MAAGADSLHAEQACLRLRCRTARIPMHPVRPRMTNLILPRLAKSAQRVRSSCRRPCCAGAGVPLMAAGGGAGVVTVWNLEQRRLHTLVRDAHDGPLVSLHFFPGAPPHLCSGLPADLQARAAGLLARAAGWHQRAGGARWLQWPRALPRALACAWPSRALTVGSPPAHAAGEPLLMSAGRDNALKHWVFDATDGAARLLRFRSGHAAPPTVVRHYSTGKLLLSAGGQAAAQGGALPGRPLGIPTQGCMPPAKLAAREPQTAASTMSGRPVSCPCASPSLHAPRPMGHAPFLPPSFPFSGQDRAFRAFSTIQDAQSRELSQHHTPARAKRLKIQEAELKLPPVLALDACDVSTCMHGPPGRLGWPR